MYRLQEEQMKLILLSVAWMYRSGHSAQEVARDSVDAFRNFHPGRHSPEEESLCTAVREIYNRGYKFSPDAYEELVKELAAMMIVDDGDRSKAELDLIDIIVNAMRSPHNKNIIRGEAFEALKRSILLPTELSTLRGKIETIGCAGCGRVFQSGEMTTLLKEDREDICFYCTKCAKPNIMCCDKCDEGVDIRRGDVNRFNAISSPNLCPEHIKVVSDPRAAKEKAAIRPHLEWNPVPVPGNPFDQGRDDRIEEIRWTAQVETILADAEIAQTMPTTNTVRTAAPLNPRRNR